MLNFKFGSVLLANADVICHQVNCKGVMRSGLAKDIATLYPINYEYYAKLCKKYDYSEKLLGQCFIFKTDKYEIANLFGQYDFGNNKQVVYTDYDALYQSLQKLRNYYINYDNINIAVPYKLGCGLANGDWKTVEFIFEKVFHNFPNFHITVYTLETKHNIEEINNENTKDGILKRLEYINSRKDELDQNEF